MCMLDTNRPTTTPAIPTTARAIPTATVIQAHPATTIFAKPLTERKIERRKRSGRRIWFCRALRGRVRQSCRISRRGSWRYRSQTVILTNVVATGQRQRYTRCGIGCDLRRSLRLGRRCSFRPVRSVAVVHPFGGDDPSNGDCEQNIDNDNDSSYCCCPGSHQYIWFETKEAPNR